MNLKTLNDELNILWVEEVA